VQHGANPHLMQKNHTTALMIAAGLGSDRATDEFFQDKGTEADAIEAIELCLEHGLDINAFNDNGDTAVHRVSGERIMATAQNWTCTTNSENAPSTLALERKDRNGAIRYPGAVAAQRELTAAPTATQMSSRP
jgi:ankyrin repeat protein